MKVMVVEDCKAIRERLLAMLETIVARQALIEAGSLSEALEHLYAQKPETIILDLTLPDGHGLNLLKEIKVFNADARVLVMTADPYDGFRKRALQLGACGFCDKAKEFDQVVEFIAEIVGRSYSKDGNEQYRC